MNYPNMRRKIPPLPKSLPTSLFNTRPRPELLVHSAPVRRQRAPVAKQLATLAARPVAPPLVHGAPVRVERALLAEGLAAAWRGARPVAPTLVDGLLVLSERLPRAEGAGTAGRCAGKELLGRHGRGNYVGVAELRNVMVVG